MTISLNNSLVNYLKILRPKISDQLIAHKYWRNIEAVAQVLPSTITTFFGFESRLGSSEAHADFLLCADAQEMGRKILADQNYPITLAPYLYGHSVWKQIRNFGEQWNNPSSPLYEQVNNMWLEFDIEESSPNIPIPSCFFGPKPIYAHSDAQWTIDTALNLLQNQEISGVIKTKILNCINSLPAEAYVFQIGVMLARKSEVVRLCIRNIAPEDILNYLSAINWNGSVEALQEKLAKISTYAERIDLDIDVGESVLPKIGLECYLSMQPKFEPKWQLFLDYLVATGFCLKEKRDSLLAYPGYIGQRQNPAYWSDDLRKISSFLGSGYETVFFKGLHHIKLTYKESKFLEAKAYLYVSQSLLTPDVLSQYRKWQNSEQLVKS